MSTFSFRFRSCLLDAPNEFIKRLEDITLDSLPESITLSVELLRPGKSVQWLIDGKKLIPDKRYEVVNKGAVHSLTIKKVVPSDHAKYTVRPDDLESSCAVTIERKFFIISLAETKMRN